MLHRIRIAALQWMLAGMVEEKGLMLQERDKLVEGAGYRELKRIIEMLTGWRSEEWRIDGAKPDSALIFTPDVVSEICRVEALCQWTMSSRNLNSIYGIDVPTTAFSQYWSVMCLYIVSWHGRLH